MQFRWPLLFGVVALLTCAFFWSRTSAQPVMSQHNLFVEMQRGGHVRLYLDRKSNDEPVSIEGKLLEYDGQTYCLQSRRLNPQTKQDLLVTQWAPNSSVLFVEKEEPSESAPALTK